MVNDMDIIFKFGLDTDMINKMSIIFRFRLD